MVVNHCPLVALYTVLAWPAVELNWIRVLGTPMTYNVPPTVNCMEVWLNCSHVPSVAPLTLATALNQIKLPAEMEVALKFELMVPGAPHVLGVAVGRLVGVGVGVFDGVGVIVAVGVLVGVPDGVGVNVLVGVAVGGLVGVAVGGIGVFVGKAGMMTLHSFGGVFGGGLLELTSRK